MKIETKITQTWWVNENQNEIPQEHKEELQKAGLIKVNEMMLDDYTGGELFYSIEDIQYNGWWEINTEVLG